MSDKPDHTFQPSARQKEDASENMRTCIMDEHRAEFNEHLQRFYDKNGNKAVKDETTSKYGDVTTSISFYVGDKQFRQTDSDTPHDGKQHTLEVYGADGKIRPASKLEARHARPVLKGVEEYFKNGEKCVIKHASKVDEIKA